MKLESGDAEREESFEVGIWKLEILNLDLDFELESKESLILNLLQP